LGDLQRDVGVEVRESKLLKGRRVTDDQGWGGTVGLH
jgi:hypothetical protein